MSSSSRNIFLLFISLLPIFFTACSGGETGTAQTSSSCASCDTSLWKFMYHRYRLQVIKKCFSANGTIQEMRKERDGDYHILLKLDTGLNSLLNEKNLEKQKGCLVVEVICQNKVKQEDAIDACENCTSHIEVPPAGSHVKVNGSYVFDKEHGWMEIHPVTGFEPLQ